MVGLTKAAKGKILLPFFLFITLSCSIIEDSDIQSQEELDTRLKLDRITFVEQTSDVFNPDALTIVGTTTINDLGQITKIDWGGGIALNNPNVVGPIVRFNYMIDDSKNFPNTISSNIIYDSNGHPLTITHVDEVNDFQFESFEFTYNNQGKVATMVTTRNSNGGTLNQRFSDVINYGNGRIASVDRTIENLDTSIETFQTITVSRRSSGIIRETKIDFMNGSNRTFEQYNEDNEGSYYYFTQLLGSAGGSTGNPVVKPVFSNFIQSMQLIDQRQDQFGSPIDPDRGADVFLIHPFLILPGLFGNDLDMSQVFINDWWVGSDIKDPGSNFYETDRIVHINYTYGVD